MVEWLPETKKNPPRPNLPILRHLTWTESHAALLGASFGLLVFWGDVARSRRCRVRAGGDGRAARPRRTATEEQTLKVRAPNRRARRQAGAVVLHERRRRRVDRGGGRRSVSVTAIPGWLKARIQWVLVVGSVLVGTYLAVWFVGEVIL